MSKFFVIYYHSGDIKAIEVIAWDVIHATRFVTKTFKIDTSAIISVQKFTKY